MLHAKAERSLICERANLLPTDTERTQTENNRMDQKRQMNKYIDARKRKRENTLK